MFCVFPSKPNNSRLTTCPHRLPHPTGENCFHSPKKQNTINKDGEEVVLEAKGRHDPCVLPRAVPIVESMAALVIADYLLIKRANKKNTK